jgi:hypothetical protein
VLLDQKTFDQRQKATKNTIEGEGGHNIAIAPKKACQDGNATHDERTA